VIGAGVTALAGGVLGARQEPAVPGGPDRFAVNFVGDGLELSPSAYADLLARLSRSGVASDEYSRGGEVVALEKQFAALLGKEAAVFMPSGTLANHLAVRTLSGTRRRVLVQDVSHLYNDSGDCAQKLSELTLVPLAPGRATFAWDEALAAIERGASGRVPTPVGAISIESPVRRLHGEAFSFDAMRQISAEARKRGIGLHLDGARLFVECAYFHRSPASMRRSSTPCTCRCGSASTPAAAPSSRGRRLCSRTCTRAPDVRRRALERVAVCRRRAALRGGLPREARRSGERRAAADRLVRHGPRRVHRRARAERDEPLSPDPPYARSPGLPPEAVDEGHHAPGAGRERVLLKVNESLRGAFADTLVAVFRAALL
jgi:hypothetical protein